MWTRRNVLRAFGTAGAGACPLVQTLATQAATAAPRKRLVMVVMTNGLQPNLYRPAGAPKATDAILERPVELRDMMAPLEPYKNDLTLIEGFYNPIDKGLHGNEVACTTMLPAGPRRVPTGPSIDRHIAKVIGTATPFSSINLATVPPPDHLRYQLYHHSYDGKGAIFPADTVPITAFARLFGKGVSTSGADPQAGARRLLRKQSLLDFVRDDVAQMQRVLPAAEKAKLDQYTESLRGLEKQIRDLGTTQSACAAPLIDPQLNRTPTWPVPDNHIDAHFSLAFSALNCGLTQVVSLAFSSSDDGTSHYGFGALPFKESHHQYSHAGNTPALVAMNSYMFGKIAALWKRLKEVPEGNGTMADNTLFLIVNDGGGSHHDGTDDIPFVLLGSAGKSFRTGRMISLPPKKYTPADLYVSVANACGVPTATFGTPALNKGPLPALGA